MVEYWKKAALILGLGTWTDSLDFAVLLTAMPLLILALNLGPAELTWISAIPTYIGLGASLLSGPLVDVIGRKKMWVLGNGLSGLAYLFGVFLCRSWIDLMIVRVIGVVGMGFTIATYFTWLPEEVPADKRQTVMGVVGMLQILAGLSLSGLLALSGIAPWIGWQVMFAWTAVWDLALTGVGAVVLKESSVWAERKKIKKEEKEREKVSYRALIAKEWRLPFSIGLLIGLTYSMFGLFATASGFTGHFATIVLEFPPWLQGVLGIISTPIIAVYRPIVGRVSDKLGRLKTLLLFNLIALPAGLLAAFTPVLVGIGPYLHVIAFNFILGQIAGLTSSGQEDTGKVVLSELVPTTARGTAQSFLEFIKGIVIGSLTIVVGVIYSINPMWGMAFPMILGTVVGLSVVLAAIKLGFETKGKVLAV
jgi:MFS family permease